jgi:hypothetical protein
VKAEPPHRHRTCNCRYAASVSLAKLLELRVVPGAGIMSFRPAYLTRPCDRLEVKVVQPDGGRALAVGKLDVAG